MPSARRQSAPGHSKRPSNSAPSYHHQKAKSTINHNNNSNNSASDNNKTLQAHQRPNRKLRRTSPDPDHTLSYGTPISYPKHKSSIRILHQNIKGLSHNLSCEDYEYYLTHLRDLQVDIAGMSETNTAWQHQYLRQTFMSRARKAGDGLAKISFGSPSVDIDYIPPNET